MPLTASPEIYGFVPDHTAGNKLSASGGAQSRFEGNRAACKTFAKFSGRGVLRASSACLKGLVRLILGRSRQPFSGEF
jgi:hypothetical protein